MTRAQIIEHIAWTGGSSPRPMQEIGVEEYAYAMELFFEDVRIWEDYWNEPINKGANEIFWNRARGDAHATFRDL